MRKSLVLPIESRDSTLAKDSKLQNLMCDPKSPQKVMKRPGMVQTSLYSPAGQGHGIFTSSNGITYVWTSVNPGDYPAMYDYAPDYWSVGSSTGNNQIYWENNQQIVEVPLDVFNSINIGDTVTISSVSPNGYNGTCLVVVDKQTAAQMGVGNGNSILITNLSNPGAVANGGRAIKLQSCGSRPAFPYSDPGTPGSFSTTFESHYVSGPNPFVSGTPGTRIYSCSWTFKAGATVLGVMTGSRTVYYDGGIYPNDGVTDTVVDFGYTDSSHYDNGVKVTLGGNQQSNTIVSVAITSAPDYLAAVEVRNAMLQKKSVYDANLAAWNSLCCP